MTELENSPKEEPVWRTMLDLIASLGFIVMIFVTGWQWVTNSPNVMIYIIITGVLGVYTMSKSDVEEKKKIQNFKSRLDVETDEENYSDDIDSFEVSYLGGHPSHTIQNDLTGTLGLSETKLGFIGRYFPLGDFELSLDAITEVGEETQESLTVGRFLMVGVLALALKKKEKYLRITFKNGIGELSTVVFQTPRANWIAQMITKKRYNYISSKK